MTCNNQEGLLETAKLSDLVQFINGDRGKNYPSQSDFISSGIPFISAANLVDNRIDFSSCKFISQEKYNQIKNGKIAVDDILYCIRGSLGKFARVRSDVLGAIASSLVILRAKGNTDVDYLQYLLQSPAIQTQIILLDNGSVQGNIGARDLMRLEVPLPRFAIQQEIGKKLRTLDDKIELNRRMNRTLEEMARALFKCWFVDFEPVCMKAEGRDPSRPVSEGGLGLDPEIAALFPDSFVDSELGEIPKGWELGQIEDLCTKIYSGGTPSTKKLDYWNGELPWLSSGETRSSFITSTDRTISEAGVINSSTRFATKGSTVIASAGQGHTRGQTSMLLLDTYVNQSVIVLKANPETSSDSMLYFDLERRYDQFRAISDSASSRGSLTTKLLATINTVIPNSNIVCCFEQIITSMIKRIASSLKEVEVLSITRDSMLSNMFNNK